MKIAVITKYSFPYGMAATNRIAAYTKGLSMTKAEISVIVVEPTDNFVKKKVLNYGKYGNVRYFYPSGRYKSKMKIFRALSILSGFRFLYGIYRTFIFIVKNKQDIIIISNDTPIFIFVYSVISKLTKANTVFIFDEFPIPIRHKLKDQISKFKELFYKFVLRNIDAYISISETLGVFYNKITTRPTFILPIIVDTDRFLQEYNNKYIDYEKNTYKEIVYVGNMELSKDNVDIIIKAFSILSSKYSFLKLTLYGTPSADTNAKLQKLIYDKGLQEKVLIKGKVHSTIVSKVLANAYILVSSQPYTKRASGGFPTKLGEYLISGTPSLLCDVGENAKYVIDGIHCYFVKPNDYIEYANKLEYIINHYEQAVIVGNNGKKFIQDKYSHRTAGLNLKHFLDDIFNNKL